MQELNYIRCGDYYIPDIRLPDENRPIGRWGRMHRDYIKEHTPIHFNEQMKAAEGVTEHMKRHEQLAWVGAMNSIRSRAEEIILREIIYREDAV